MRKISLIIFLVAITLVFGWSVRVEAASNDFTASGNVTVDLTTYSVTILDGSIAESVDITSGVLTVNNPGSTSTPSFKVQPAGGAGSVRATLGGEDAGCSATTLILPITAGTYTITPQSGQCSSGGAGTGNSTESVNNGGGGGGGTTTTPTPVATSTPSTTTLAPVTTTVPAASTADFGALSVGNNNVNLSLNSQINFTASLSTSVSASHSAKVTSVDTTNKKVTVVLQSDPVTVELALGEVKKVDLDGDGVNDLSVKFNNLVGGAADLIIVNIASMEAAGLASGDLIKTATDSAVYYIDTAGRRNLFVNAVTFWTWYSGDWSNITYGGEKKVIKTVSQADFDDLLIGGHVTVKPASKLIKFQNSKRAYTVTPNGVLREVIASDGNNAVAKALYGNSYQVLTIQNGFEDDYTKGEALTATNDKPTATSSLAELFN